MIGVLAPKITSHPPLISAASSSEIGSNLSSSIFICWGVVYFLFFEKNFIKKTPVFFEQIQKDSKAFGLLFKIRIFNIKVSWIVTANSSFAGAIAPM